MKIPFGKIQFSVKDAGEHCTVCYGYRQEVRNGRPSADLPPPIPPRPGEDTSNRSYLGMPSQSYGAIGSFGGFGSPFGMYGSSYGCGLPGYSRFGMGAYGPSYGQSNDNNFVRMAEESSRQAFQSVESIVQAFASVSMMLESTYFAVHSSFRAVLGVAEHFSRLKGQMSHMMSALALIKYLKWFVRRILYLLSLSENDPNQEDVWRRATSSSTNGLLTPESIIESLTKPERKKSSWPILIFFSVVFGTPWLIWKLLTSLTGGADDEKGLLNVTKAKVVMTFMAENEKWMSRQGDHYVAVGMYPFASNNPNEIAFEANQELIIAPKGKL